MELWEVCGGIVMKFGSNTVRLLKMYHSELGLTPSEELITRQENRCHFSNSLYYICDFVYVLFTRILYASWH